MNTTDQLLEAFQAYQEVRAEILGEDSAPGDVLPGAMGRPAREVSLPDGSLLLGLAEDGLPLAVDLYDPTPGPLLVAGEGGCGKTALLQSLARHTDLHDPGDVQFGVLTPFPEEWPEVEVLPNCLGIWPAYHRASADFLARLASWAEVLPAGRQVVVLLVDGLDLLAAGSPHLQPELRWLLRNGPERRVWPVVSANPGRLTRLQTWLGFFHTYIFGQVRQARTAGLLTADTGIDLAGLVPGAQFILNQDGAWTRFWIPPL